MIPQIIQIADDSSDCWNRNAYSAISQLFLNFRCRWFVEIQKFIAQSNYDRIFAFCGPPILTTSIPHGILLQITCTWYFLIVLNTKDFAVLYFTYLSLVHYIYSMIILELCGPNWQLSINMSWSRKLIILWRSSVVLTFHSEISTFFRRLVSLTAACSLAVKNLRWRFAKISNPHDNFLKL